MSTLAKEKSVSKETSNISNVIKPASNTNNIKNDFNKVGKPLQGGSSNLNNTKKPVDSSNLKNGNIKSLLEKAKSKNNDIIKPENNINISRSNDKNIKDQKVNNKTVVILN